MASESLREPRIELHARTLRIFEHARVQITAQKPPSMLGYNKKGRFEYFVFGGILGDKPAKRRTESIINELKQNKIKFEERNLGTVRMPTDNAVYASKKILEGNADFSKDALRVSFQGKNIKDVLNLTIDEALEIFKTDTLIVRKLKFLEEVGLGYLVLGQKSGSLSGGEAQRVRVANILSKKLGDRSVYVFDTPSRGLHLKDIPVLIDVFKKIVNKNNTILIADNREEIFDYCDYKIEI